MNELTLGIDTSCYTTSVALASAGRVVQSKRKLLSVPEGEKGLRQSDGVFQHVRALPALLEEMLSECPNVRIGCVCASDRPRDALDSYMPVFTAGASFARALAAALNVPAYFTSHQQGHIRAAMQDSGIPCGPFVALHLSGGTTQTLLTDETLSVRDIGGSSDLNAGQLVVSIILFSRRVLSFHRVCSRRKGRCSRFRKRPSEERRYPATLRTERWPFLCYEKKLLSLLLDIVCGSHR